MYLITPNGNFIKDEIMRRKIKMKNGRAYFEGSFIGEPTYSIKHSFGLASNGFYNITIVKGTSFKINDGAYYHIYDANKINNRRRHRGVICKKAFEQLFFKPDLDKKYDVTVKKVEECKEQLQ